MDKTLNILQTLAKIGKVISKIGYVCSIIGAIGCAAGIAPLAAGATNVLKIGGVTIHGLIEQSDEMSIGSMYLEVIVALIIISVICRYGAEVRGERDDEALVNAGNERE